ncbi:6252_t:CDS:2 [Funneliformis geosporum]|uniref:6252_t:CDS:1 n=1 Tax=Funneliformis geosporum TaxID=1117311 RepID=A0A9W4SFY8_9GLOM|nr:6252_t:CDS:2 [Funneliformis geosporum]
MVSETLINEVFWDITEELKLNKIKENRYNQLKEYLIISVLSNDKKLANQNILRF